MLLHNASCVLKIHREVMPVMCEETVYLQYMNKERFDEHSYMQTMSTSTGIILHKNKSVKHVYIIDNLYKYLSIYIHIYIYIYIYVYIYIFLSPT